MYSAYVGLLTPQGLVNLVPESEQASFTILRRLRRDNSRNACGVWFVVEPCVAQAAEVLIDAGECNDARRLLEERAREAGVLSPALTDF